MGYSQAYYLDCDEPIIDYVSDCCNSAEYGRVRSVAFIRKRYLQLILSDPSDLITWQNGIASGDIIVLMFTTGSFTSGIPKKLKGFGRRLSTHGNRDMLLNIQVPFKENNFTFFDDLDKRTDYVPAFRTDSFLHICDKPADILTTETIEDDLESNILWSFECTVRTKSLPVKVSLSTLSSLFSCTPGGGSGGSGDCSDQVYSDWWVATAGTSELTGFSTQRGYGFADISSLVAVRRENQPLFIVLSGTPSNEQCKLDTINHKLLINSDVPFNANERVFIIFKKPS